MNPKYILGIAVAGIAGALLAVGIMKSTSAKEGGEAGTGDRVAGAGNFVTGDASPQPEERESGAGTPSPAGEIAGTPDAPGEDAGLGEDERAARRDEFRANMRERQMDQLTTKMAKWSAALGLDKTQQEKLLDMAGEQMDELEQMAVDASQGGDPAALSETARRAMSIISGRALEESMAEILTPEQRVAYEDFGARRDESRAEARALRQLAGLQEDLMLTPAQRNATYAILYENASADVKEGDEVGSVIESMASSAGVNLDPSLQGMIASLANRGLAELASGKELNAESIREMSQQAFDEALNQRVDLLRPALTEAQLEIYRSQLEGRLGGLMQRAGVDPPGE